jgi:acyl dehydratase
MLSKTQVVIPEQCIGFAMPPVKSRMEWIDAILYHISIGYGQDPMNEKDLRYVFEGHEDFAVFPTSWTLVRGYEILGPIMACPGMPFFNALKLLHGESEITVFKDVHTDTNYLTVGELTDVADKGSGCLVTMDIKTYEEQVDEDDNPIEGALGDLCVINTCSLFIRGLGGFGFPGKYERIVPVIPPVASVQNSITTYKKPVRVVTEKTSPQTAHIYRLCGDGNPLHIDPAMGRLSGFDRPILHGLCHFGISAKVVVQTFLDGDHTRLKNHRVRFTSHFFPGETLVFKFWTLEGGKVLFAASTKERGKDVLKGEALLDMGAKL